MKRLGVPREVPFVTVQWQGILAISYSARKYGIGRHDTLESAKERCPHLSSQHVATYAEGEEEARYHENPSPETHKISLDPYRRESRKIVAVFNEFCPLGAVEKASIDELYCDLTLAVRQLILQRFPHLARPPEDSTLGLDTPLPDPPEIAWDGLGYRMPTNEDEKKEYDADKALRKKRQEEEDSEVVKASQASGKSQGDADDVPEGRGRRSPSTSLTPARVERAATWTDYALACGAELIAVVRKAVLDRLGYTMTAGIASNKTLAKLIASENKPNNQTVMLPGAVPLYLCDLPFQKIRFLGGKLGDAIASEWQHSTVGDLWSVSLVEMQQKFGDESRWVYDVLRGIDHSAVIERTKNKTMLASKNVKPTIKTPQEAKRWLSILSSELTVRLREAREESPTLWPGTIVLRYLKPRETARSRQAHFPFVRDLKAEHVYKVAQRLWDEALGGLAVYEVVTVALGFSQLDAGEQGQKSIEGWFGGGGVGSSGSGGADGSGSGRRSADTAASNANAAAIAASSSAAKRSASPDPNASGNGSVGNSTAAHAHPPPPSAPPRKKPKRNGIESMFAASQQQQQQQQHRSTPPSSTTPPTMTSTDEQGNSLSPAPPASTLTWTCPECSKIIYPLSRADVDGEDDNERRLTLAKQDHQDYHFALNLQREANAALMPRGSLSSQAASPSASQPASSQRRGGAKRGANGSANKHGIQNFFKKPSAG